jgi:hypothetical protein
MSGACGTYGGGELHTGVLFGNLRESDHFKDLCVNEGTILKWTFKKWHGGPGLELIWLRVWTGGGLLSTRFRVP